MKEKNGLRRFLCLLIYDSVYIVYIIATSEAVKYCCAFCSFVVHYVGGLRFAFVFAEDGYFVHPSF